MTSMIDLVIARACLTAEELLTSNENGNSSNSIVQCMYYKPPGTVTSISPPFRARVMWSMHEATVCSTASIALVFVEKGSSSCDEAVARWRRSRC